MMASTAGSSWRRPASGSVSSDEAASPANTEVSMPLENARPSPITTSARSSRSSRSVAPSSRSSRHISGVNAFNRSGRESRSHPTGPTRSKRIVVYAMTSQGNRSPSRRGSSARDDLVSLGDGLGDSDRDDRDRLHEPGYDPRLDRPHLT